MGKAGMVEGGNDGRREWWKAGMSDAVALGKLAFLREASFPLNPSFPRKRESRDHCDRKAGIGRTALDCHFPIGLGDKLRGNDGGAVDSRFRGNDRWAGMMMEVGE